MATPDTAQAQTVVASNAQARSVLTDNLSAQVAFLLAGFSAWYSDSQVADLAEHIASVLVPTLRIAASQQDAYLAQIASLSGRVLSPVGPVDVTTLRRGTTPQRTYQRLGEQYRYQRSTGDGPDRALAVTQNRAAVMTETDVALAARAQSQSFMTKHGIAEYRRVIHPELSRGGTCGLCVAAAQHLAPSADLMALHGRCRCTEVPVIGKTDVGHALNQSDLAGLDIAPEDYRVVHHAETGPVLTRAA